MIKRIFVDMDGVLCDFRSRYETLFKSAPKEDYPHLENDKEFKRFFDEFVNGGNFAKLDPMIDLEIGLEYLKIVENTHKEIEIYILTSTAREKYYDILSTDKFLWLKEHNIPYLPIFVPGKRFKKLYAEPHSVLIDDTKKNIDDWVESGGIGIHHSSWLDSIFQLGQLI